LDTNGDGHISFNECKYRILLWINKNSNEYIIYVLLLLLIMLMDILYIYINLNILNIIFKKFKVIDYLYGKYMGDFSQHFID